MKLAFLQFIDDDCCVLPGMLAGVVGIHAKPKKDCHSSGHPHHATVWAKHQHHNTDKFLELCTQKPRTWQCHIPRTPGTSYAFLCLAISLKHSDTSNARRNFAIRPSGHLDLHNRRFWHGLETHILLVQLRDDIVTIRSSAGQLGLPHGVRKHHRVMLWFLPSTFAWRLRRIWNMATIWILLALTKTL